MNTSSPNYSTRHHVHWITAFCFGLWAVALEVGAGWTFVAAVFLAIAAAEVAIGWQLRERALDEPVLEQLIKHVEDHYSAELGDMNWKQDR